jgi:uncharacterized protein (TIGR03083 family)
MESEYFLAAADSDARTLLAAAEAGWRRPIPQCPEWSASELVGHTGVIMLWVSAVVSRRKRVSRRALERPPRDPVELKQWYLRAVDNAFTVLGAEDPESETWTFSSSGDRRVGWWYRRLAVEVAVHRWDAQQAVSGGGGAPIQPLDGIVAASGIGEFLQEFVPGLLAAMGIGDHAGTLQFSAIDTHDEWSIDLGAGAPAPHKSITAAVQGSRSDLLLWLMRSNLLLWLLNRGRTESLELRGDPLSSNIASSANLAEIRS